MKAKLNDVYKTLIGSAGAVRLATGSATVAIGYFSSHFFTLPLLLCMEYWRTDLLQQLEFSEMHTEKISGCY